MTMEPLISLCLVGPRPSVFDSGLRSVVDSGLRSVVDGGLRSYAAGDELVAEYQLDAVLPDEVQAVEASVLWHTEGKGEEDLGVHFFERRLPGDTEDGDLRPLRRFRTTLPSSPLSYSGAILTIRWCVRVRLFLRRGREYLQEQPFTLGSVPAVAREAAAAT
jgi:hypothetical protein